VFEINILRRILKTLPESFGIKTWDLIQCRSKAKFIGAKIQFFKEVEKLVILSL